MLNIFLTGEKGIGKSTIIHKIIKRYEYSIGGYTVIPIIRENFKYFYITSINNGIENSLMAIGDINKKKIIHIYEDALENFASKLINSDINKKEIIILDEIGFIESQCNNFKTAVMNALDSNKIVLGVLKDFNGDFINKIKKRKDVIIFRVTKENRNILPEIIYKKISL
ncbi:nucleoside-triphosphatase [Clostridium tetanomorphum]|uniref:AAA family ATPase n=1 Tax=Clostridium tetanomorphum TaxID=1553 RepID=A0A923EB12_CLOTT|nr:nucleoside-triphosphatase [Clostridium tetanomorphum]KAJ48802.1 hypothetical protein CTM_26462 [Clostridium tetanomorphum DSM 665]KAJ52059.1 hypothetical protein CTM_09811 [Clostridium tetanomorphum DSM 665]MBC2397068.1 AAA family ATPase [Clostridium tetanomorphum]MBP1862979.1 nucleoside-triphosphatase [Clostridium tetanomorphum]NRS82808.1 nucleoside-triphosphatase [Clostridium tetanomorphum]